jgi:energy-coupling factor transporter transmembrane protein EcfT
MRIADLDHLAANGVSWLHRASPLAKWLLLAAAILVAILTPGPWPVFAAYASLALAGLSCRLPMRLLIVLSLLPVPLVGLFALSQWDGNPAVLLAIVGRGMLTALAGVLLAATTSYPDLLAPLTSVLPPVLADSLVLTYRSIFILGDRAEVTFRALRARGGFFPRLPAGTLP